jgi:hypothetical protein
VAKKALHYLAQAASAKKPEVKAKSLRLARKYFADISAERHPELTEQIEGRLLWEEGHRPETYDAEPSVNPNTGAQDFFGPMSVDWKNLPMPNSEKQEYKMARLPYRPGEHPPPQMALLNNEKVGGATVPSIPDTPIKGRPTPDWNPEVEKEVGRRAAAIFGETTSLRPQLINPEGSLDTPENWNPDSAALLHQARTKLAAMYGGPNDHMKPRLPSNVSNPIEKRQWDLAVEAARASMGFELDPRLINMNMRQKGVGHQVVDEWIKTGRTVLDPIGPFINTYYPNAELIKKGRAAGGGPNTYIDFYGREKPGS